MSALIDYFDSYYSIAMSINQSLAESLWQMPYFHQLTYGELCGDSSIVYGDVFVVSLRLIADWFVGYGFPLIKPLSDDSLHLPSCPP